MLRVTSRWREIGERRQVKEKMFEKAQFTRVNEHFEAIFDKELSSAAMSRQRLTREMLG